MNCALFGVSGKGIWDILDTHRFLPLKGKMNKPHSHIYCFFFSLHSYTMLLVSKNAGDLKTSKTFHSVLIIGSFEIYNKCQKKVIFHQENSC